MTISTLRGRRGRGTDRGASPQRCGWCASQRVIGLVVATTRPLEVWKWLRRPGRWNVAGPDRVMAIRWPRREDHHDPTTARARDLVPLVGLERQQRARSCLDDVASGFDTRRSLHNHQPSPLAHLVLTEFLTRREANDDRSGPVDGFERCSPTCPLGCVNLFHIPGLHGADSRRSRMVGLALLPGPRPKARNLPTRYGARDAGAQANRIRHAGPACVRGGLRLEQTAGGS